MKATLYFISRTLAGVESRISRKQMFFCSEHSIVELKLGNRSRSPSGGSSRENHILMSSEVGVVGKVKLSGIALIQDYSQGIGINQRNYSYFEMWP